MQDSGFVKLNSANEPLNKRIKKATKKGIVPAKANTIRINQVSETQKEFED